MKLLCDTLKMFNNGLTFTQIKKIITSAVIQNEAIDKLKRNPYFEKYSEKILEKQNAVQEFIQSQERKRFENFKFNKNQVCETFSPGKEKCSNSFQRKCSNLNSVMKIDLIKNRSSEEITRIWNEYHESKNYVLSAVIPDDIFKIIQEKSKKYPVFLLPLPRNQGYEFILLQFNENEVHFTPLISYQTHKENASECLIISYYVELLNEKNIVLMRGEYDNNVINIMEAQCLLNQVQLYYGENNDKRTKIMDRFSYHSDDFNYMDLIAEIECISF